MPSVGWPHAPAEPAPTMTKSKQPNHSCRSTLMRRRRWRRHARQGQRRGQARRFDPEQIDYACMPWVSVRRCGNLRQVRLGRRFSAGCPRSPAQAGYRAAAANKSGSRRRIYPSGRIDSVVERLNHSTSGRTALAAQIERQVHAETAGLWYRVDQARERCSAGEREIVSLAYQARGICASGKLPCGGHLSACSPRSSPPSALSNG